MKNQTNSKLEKFAEGAIKLGIYSVYSVATIFHSLFVRDEESIEILEDSYNQVAEDIDYLSRE